jgi:hypothetical protein
MKSIHNRYLVSGGGDGFGGGDYSDDNDNDNNHNNNAIYLYSEFDSLKLVHLFYSLTINPLTWKIW